MALPVFGRWPSCHFLFWQVALISLLEVLLGPFWVFVRFGDVPSAWTVAGGTVLMAALAWHEVVTSRSRRQQDDVLDMDAQSDQPYHRVDK